MFYSNQYTVAHSIPCSWVFPEFLSESCVTVIQWGLKSIHESCSADGGKASPLEPVYPQNESKPSYDFLGIFIARKSKGRCGGICIITAWACEQGLCVGQLKTEEKSNEKTAIPILLQEIELKNTIVSIDAIANNPSIAKQIVSRGGDYILSLKKNQRATFEQVSDYMKANSAFFEIDKNVDFGSGRVETRTCYVAVNLNFMENILAWEGIKSVIMIHAKREIRDKVEEQYRFYLSSKAQTPHYFNSKIRAHWGIENKLHWHLDVSFNEDRSRTKMGNGAENHNTLRKISLQLLQQQKDKHSIKERRKKVGWNDQYLLNIIKNSPN